MRLLCTCDSGQTAIYTLKYGAQSTWSVDPHPVAAEASPHPIPGGSFILDAKKGYPLRADRKGLASVLQPEQAGDSPNKCIWVSAGAKGTRCMLNVNGERVSRIEWGSKVGTVVHVEVVGHLGAYVDETVSHSALTWAGSHLRLVRAGCVHKSRARAGILPSAPRANHHA